MSDNLRWSLADQPSPQLTLFDEVPVRTVGKGAYRGLEFLEVRAKTLINEVPAGPLPFRYTINVYRGCSHACVYCLSGDTPVLTADGRLADLRDVRTGDVVVGTERRGRYRRYVESTVLDHWTTTARAHRITLDDGASLICGPDHRFLTDRGWKFATGAQQGSSRRAHLTPSNLLIGPGGATDRPKENEGYRRGYLCGMIRGDGHLGTYRYPAPGGAHRVVHRFRLALIDSEPLDRAEAYLLAAGVTTRRFEFSAATATRSAMHAVRTSRASAVDAIRDIIAWPDIVDDDWSRGFLAGIFDAEGSYSQGVLRIANTDGELIDRIHGGLRRFGFDAASDPGAQRQKRVTYVRIRGGLMEHLRFLHTVDPATTRKRTFTGRAVKNAVRRVVAIEPLGFEIPMYDLTTTTGDFVANGVISHNCFARPTHEYLGLGIGADFDSKIVVKVNAPELARVELHPGRWGGGGIAMGTNTDPYQAAEGKYRLTRGVLEALGERKNPFSILTKSPLVLRDIDLLVEAAKDADVKVDFSVGTVDEEVWRATEPGTAHPRKRIEAVARLNEAGIPSGVLMAPVLPGMSDRRDQLAAVVAAAVDAGARFIAPMYLHLKPGVKEHVMDWVESEHPDLADDYGRRYAQRVRAPRSAEARLGSTVAELVEEIAPARHPARRSRRTPQSVRKRSSQPRLRLDGPPTSEAPT